MNRQLIQSSSLANFQITPREQEIIKKQAMEQFIVENS